MPESREILADPLGKSHNHAMRRFLPLLAMLFPLLVLAELPPSAYEQMQKAATEYVDIEVLRVDASPGKAPGEQNIHLMALVNKVHRAANLKTGDVINILYAITPRERSWTGPGEIPLLQEKDQSLAYLVKNADSADFHPAAGAMSFHNF